MKDASMPNLTSLATSIRLLAAILLTIFQLSRSNISGTAKYKCTKFEQLIALNVLYIPSKFDRYYSVRLYNAKPFSNTQAYISECI